jgi:hypothetical protein
MQKVDLALNLYRVANPQQSCRFHKPIQIDDILA